MKIKKRLIAAILFMVIGGYITHCAFYRIYSPENKSYLEKILNEDPEIKEKFGHVKKFKVVKAGRSEQPPTSGGYVNFTTNIYGEKENGRIIIYLYKDENGKLQNYSLRRPL